jgi:TolB-like protein/Flp pilus assembly protein TadD
MPSIVRFDCFEVDLAAGQHHKRGSNIRLRDQSFQVLALLLERPGQVVTREDLHHRLWADDVFVDFENSLNVAVARLREALGDSADHPRYIETLPRRGYRFIAPVSEGVAAAGPKPIARLLVLPFVNSSGDPSQEYFSDAMTDEVITELSTLDPARLAVLARTTAMHYKQTHKDVARIAREVAVDYVVEGSVRRADGRICLTVQLVRASDQMHVFARRYEADFAGIFDVQRTVARTLAAEIGIVSDLNQPAGGNAFEPPAVRRPTTDLIAYNWYIQGRHHLNAAESPQVWVKVRQCLEAAIARDPLFALAYDALAELWWMAGFVGMIAPRDALAAGIVHASRAVEIDSNLAEAHAMLAQYRKQLEYNWADVRQEMARALELNPASPMVRMRYATTGLMPFGYLDEAVAELERAVDLDPLATYPRIWLQTMLWLGRHYDRAIEQGRIVLELAPTHFIGHWSIGMVYCDAGRVDLAIAAHRKAADLTHDAPIILGWLGRALAQSGDEAGARAILERLRVTQSKAYVPPTSFAWIHIGLGEVDRFFEWMDCAIDARDHMIMPIKTYPFLDPIRDDPRYLALLGKMNLA